MGWEKPGFVELDMNAEIGGYQQDDDSRPADEPVVAPDDAQA